MSRIMKKIAIYGKGGIGKSSIAANITAALARSGKKVLQIGCDPKADSTRLLTHEKIPTVLDKLNESEKELTIDDIVFPSRVPGVTCIEAGGPHAGVGCAGMGITAMENELQRLHVFHMDWDVVVYDVLGDVVCGGFAVPMRKHFVDQVYIVTSSDYMSLYAANNILRAVEYYSYGDARLAGGLIWNHVRGAQDREIAESFVKRTETKIAGWIPESEMFRNQDYSGCLIGESEPDSEIGIIFRELAEQMLRENAEDKRPRPMSNEEIEEWRRMLLQSASICGREGM